MSIPTPELDPRWNRARELLAHGRGLAAELAEEIERLRAQFLGQGQGRRTDKQPSSQVVIKVDAQGFQAQLRAQLGLHPQQAARLLENSQRTRLLAQIADAEPGEVVTIDAERDFEVTLETKALARDAFNDLTLGNVTAGRAWAGISKLAVIPPRVIEIKPDTLPTESGKDLEPTPTRIAFPAPSISADAIRAGRIASEESENLWLLKATWRKTNKKDRSAFVKWTQNQK